MSKKTIYTKHKYSEKLIPLKNNYKSVRWKWRLMKKYRLKPDNGRWDILLRKIMAAKCIARIYRTAKYNPQYKMCRKHLLNTFDKD